MFVTWAMLELWKIVCCRCGKMSLSSMFQSATWQSQLDVDLQVSKNNFPHWKMLNESFNISKQREYFLLYYNWYMMIRVLNKCFCFLIPFFMALFWQQPYVKIWTYDKLALYAWPCTYIVCWFKFFLMFIFRVLCLPNDSLILASLNYFIHRYYERISDCLGASVFLLNVRHSEPCKFLLFWLISPQDT